MIFATASGNIDIVAGDLVSFISDVLPKSTTIFEDLFSIQAVSGGNPTQVQVNYISEAGPAVVWVDATWINANYRPILPL